jgi:succinate dehydrogenase/fumarate reductase cytochrome b subunit
MSYRLFIFALLAFSPVVASAQTIQSLLFSFTTFVGNTLVPFVFGLAFLFFLVNAVRYFIIEAANEDGRKKARQLAIWGILAFIIMLSIWSIVGFIMSDLGLFRPGPVCPDYMPSC